MYILTSTLFDIGQYYTTEPYAQWKISWYQFNKRLGGLDLQFVTIEISARSTYRTLVPWSSIRRRNQHTGWLYSASDFNNNNNNNLLIDIAVPNTHNLAKTITDKQNKHQELANEMCAMCQQKAAQVIPIVMSSTTVIPKSPSQSLTRLKLWPNTYIQLQKSVILFKCSIVRNFLNHK